LSIPFGFFNLPDKAGPHHTLLPLSIQQGIGKIQPS
jgi:hypothetical protein